ncbi:MAG: hypothetical protein GX580_06435 [Candidatus Hydrogenedens sp.]|nr:discoidin domain-containing protein [Candidatus Hydrogenedentota bacterium]NLF57258.1 hypothetical protein [Candidatus Hydrogenedens sp.]
MQWTGMTAAGLVMVLAFVFGPAEDGAAGFVTASSAHPGDFAPHRAVDGDPSTRWAGATGNPGEWLQIDLGRVMPVGDLRLLWEAAFAQDYEVQLSKDGTVWTTAYHQTNGTGGGERVPVGKKQGRFVRILCNAPGGGFSLYSLWEVEFLDKKTDKALRDRFKQVEEERMEATRARRAALAAALEREGVREVVYATRALYADGHWYANISYFADDENRKTYVSGGGLYVVSLADGSTRALVEDPEGTLRDPAVHYDGRTILFSWRRGGTDTFHLWTVQSDGGGLTQLTRGEYDDIEPAWLPDGGIVFVSTRSRRWVNCWLTQVATLHRCDADGRNVLPLSANIEHDNTPWPLPDGRILYTRWEYVDRSQVDYHHLWAMNPDGTGQMTHFGNMHPPDLYIDAKPVPGTEEILFINSPGHGAKEHAGHVALVDVKRGPDHLPSLRNITGNGYRDPYPVSADAFLAARGRELVLLDRDGVQETLHRIPVTPDRRELHEPRPIRPRSRERVIPARVNYAKETGRLLLSDVRLGRNMDGVGPGEIAKLLVVESLPKPINYTGGMDPLSYGGTFTLERVLGTVPVEEDGSAYMELPANRSLFLVALDRDDNTVKRMQSFLTVMPGELTSCVGCHEQRTHAPLNPGKGSLMAARREPSAVTPVPDIPEVFDYPRDIQPILDRHCVKCHDYAPHPDAEHGPRAGGAVLAGDRGPLYSHSYASLTVLGQVSDGRDQAVSNYAPRSLGAAASPLMAKVLGGHHGVALSPKETAFIRYWIETGAAYPGTYGALGGGGIGGYHENMQIETDYEWPESKAAAAAIEKRCYECHNGMTRVPKQLSDENDVSFWRPEWNDPRLKRARHLVFNLTRPEYSLMLLAPLAKEAGGYGICNAQDGDGAPRAVFADTADPDYQAILALCVAGKNRLETIKRFDMPGFQPPYPYIREMRRYGVLAADLPANAPVDPYASDLAYWASFDQRVALEHPAYAE